MVILTVCTIVCITVDFEVRLKSFEIPRGGGRQGLKGGQMPTPLNETLVVHVALNAGTGA